MGRTIAEALQEKGRRKGRREGAIRARQETLLRQLHARFGELPAALVTVIEASREVHQLDAWLDRIVVAKTLKDAGIQPVP